MSHSKNIVSILLVILMLGTGLPVFHSGDVTRDGNTDLQDVILSVKGLEQLAQDSDRLDQNFKQVVTSLTTVAGLKTVFKQANDTNSSNSTQSLDIPYLKCTSDKFALTGLWSGVEDNKHVFNSMNTEPALPPPQIS